MKSYAKISLFSILLLTFSQFANAAIMANCSWYKKDFDQKNNELSFEIKLGSGLLDVSNGTAAILDVDGIIPLISDFRDININEIDYPRMGANGTRAFYMFFVNKGEIRTRYSVTCIYKD